MKRVTILAAILAMLGTWAVLWQRGALSHLHEDQNPGFTSEAAGNVTNANHVDAGEVMALREQTRDLPRLRNEIDHLRAARTDLVAARVENARLLEAKRTGARIPREAPPGFVSRERLAYAGYATPEAAVETFFWAMREGDIATLMQSMAPDHEDRLQFEQMSPQARAKLEEGFRMDEEGKGMRSFNDFTLAQREDTSSDTLVVHVRSSVATNTFPFGLKRFGSEWKLTDVGLSGKGRAPRAP